MPYSYIDESDVIASIKRHIKGGTVSVKTIAEELGVSPEGLGDRMRQRGYSPKDRKYLKNLYKTEPPFENRHKNYYDKILYNSTLSYQPN